MKPLQLPPRLPLQLAVIGAGHLGRIHARLAAALPGVKLVGIVDPVAAGREEVAAELGAPALANVAELPANLDVAIIATPTGTHRDVALPLIERGIHLLIEKPLCRTTAEADEIVAAAEEHGVAIQVGHVERFNPVLERLAPQLAEPKYIECVRTGSYTFRSTDVGAVLDLMIHDIDLCLALTGSTVERIEALGVSVLGGHEDAAQARLTFADGCVANLTASRVSYRSQRTLSVWTPAAFASLDLALRQATLLRPGEELLNRRFDEGELSAERKVRLKTRLFEELFSTEKIDGAEGNALAAEQADLVDAIRAAREPRVTARQGRDALAVAEQIVAAIEAHAWDGRADGRRGPLTEPHVAILPVPHLHAAEPGRQRKQAG